MKLAIFLVFQDFNTDPSSGPSHYDFSQIAAYLALSLVLFLLILFFVQRNNRDEVYKEMYASLREKIRKDVLFDISVKNSSSFDRADDKKQYSEIVKEFDAKIKALEEKLEKCLQKDQIVEEGQKRQVTEEVPATPSSVVETQVKESSNEEIFYLPSPNLDGSFNASSMQSIYKPSASIYWFKKISPDKAMFKIDSRETSVKMALQYADKSIDPVCEALNPFNASAKRISTQAGNEGQARLEGEKWKVITKAKISYE